MILEWAMYQLLNGTVIKTSENFKTLKQCEIMKPNKNVQCFSTTAKFYTLAEYKHKKHKKLS